MRDSEVKALQSGFLICRNTGHTMAESHIHNDLEMTIILKGEMDFVMGSHRVQIPVGRFVIYWAARPHRTVHVSRPFLKYGLHIPLPWFLQLQLPAAFTHRILNGDVVVDPDDSRKREDEISVARWFRNTNPPDPAKERLTMHEVETRIGWIAMSICDSRAPAAMQSSVHPLPLLRKLDTMIRFVTEHYLDPISSADVARVVQLHPKYAMNMFRKNMGMTMLAFITAQRIAHARRLLITTDKKIVEIAFQSGFGTLSRFYKAFTDSVRMSPRAYRRMVSMRRPSRA